MALSPYQFRPITPPIADDVPGLIPGSHCRTISDASSRSARSSPEYDGSFEYNPGTPLTRSPNIQVGGPVLIPQVRKQDLCPVSTSFSYGNARNHRRSSSASTNLFVPQGLQARPGHSRATTSPPEVVNYETPSTASTTYSYTGSAADFILGPQINAVSQFQRRSLGHSRSISESVINNGPVHIYGSGMQRKTSYMPNMYIPAIAQESFEFSAPAESVMSEPCFDLPAEMFTADFDAPTVSQLDYLSTPTPSVQVCRQQPLPLGKNKKPQYWFDIRNLSEWQDFNLETILGMPSFADLLNVAVAQCALPEPIILPSRKRPADQSELRALVKDFYASKLNATLRVSQGESRHMVMRTGQAHGGPDFVSNYEMPKTQTIAGNGARGRVIGLVKSFATWNTSMRTSQDPNERCRYLEGLSHLHRCLREFECRYGFIITETELVCVRYGTETTPFFGFLELTSSIRLNETSGLTAGLALWYLHMLARDPPLPGQCSYRVHVGLPGEMTRQTVLDEKDDWIATLKIAEYEKREAKQTRGWFDPTEKWNRRLEGGGMRRRR